jgi:hypothetical protein
MVQFHPGLMPPPGQYHHDVLTFGEPSMMGNEYGDQQDESLDNQLPDQLKDFSLSELNILKNLDMEQSIKFLLLAQDELRKKPERSIKNNFFLYYH